MLAWCGLIARNGNVIVLKNRIRVFNVPIHVGVLECTLDPLAERLMVLTRIGKLVAIRPAAPKLNVIVPFEYTLNNNLMCILLDDNGEKDGELVDNVKAAAIDLKTYTPPV